jgi:hypothetical protein
MIIATAIDIKLPTLPGWAIMSAILLFAVVTGLIVFIVGKRRKRN